MKQIVYSLKYKNDNGDEVEFSFKSKIIISSAGGFTENIINLSLSQGMNQIGSTVQGQAVQSKDIPVTGTIVGETTAARRQLLRAIKPLVGAKLIYNDEWEIRVYPTQTPVIEKHLTNAKFQFIVKAPFPYWNRIAGQNVFLTQMDGMFSFPWNLAESFMFGQRKGEEYVNVHNPGDIDTPFRVVFTANEELSNPAIRNLLAGTYLQVLKNMEAGETIIVDISSMGLTVTSTNARGIQTDAFGYLDIESNFYWLNPGDNIVRFDADENRNGLDAVMYYTVLRVGAYD